MAIHSAVFFILSFLLLTRDGTDYSVQFVATSVAEAVQITNVRGNREDYLTRGEMAYYYSTNNSDNSMHYFI